MEFYLTYISKRYSIKDIQPIDRGWSNELKFKLTNTTGKNYLLRICEIEDFDRRKLDYIFLKKLNKLDFEMSKAIDAGIVGKGDEKVFYQLLSWIDGEDLINIIPNITKGKQIDLGRNAGQILKQIHTLLPENKNTTEIYDNIINKNLNKLDIYMARDDRFQHDENIIKFIRENIEVIREKPPTYLHGDFHLGNMIYTKNGELGIIDINRFNIGNPYSDFLKIQQFTKPESISFAKAQINSYFEGEIPENFWLVVAVENAIASLTSYIWAEQFGNNEVENMKSIAMECFKDYEYFSRVIPTWYK